MTTYFTLATLPTLFLFILRFLVFHLKCSPSPPFFSRMQSEHPSASNPVGGPIFYRSSCVTVRHLDRAGRALPSSLAGRRAARTVCLFTTANLGSNRLSGAFSKARGRHSCQLDVAIVSGPVFHGGDTAGGSQQERVSVAR